VRVNVEQEAATTALVAEELAGPRSTAQVLALLPFVGLGLSFALGSNPFDFLVGQALGRVCLLLGVGLACLGVVWSELLARRVSGWGPAPAGGTGGAS
jgi:tight adherence protein B